MAVLQSLQQEAGSQSGFAHTSFANEHQVFVFGDEVEFGKGAYLLAIHTGLARPGKRFQGPAFRQIGTADAPLQRTFLPIVPLLAQQSGDELRVRNLRFLSRAQLFVVNAQHAP
jgi:hypothetical protein